MNYSKFASLVILALSFSPLALADSFPLCESSENVLPNHTLRLTKPILLTKSRLGKEASVSFDVKAQNVDASTYRCTIWIAADNDVVIEPRDRQALFPPASNCNVQAPSNSHAIFSFDIGKYPRRIQIYCSTTDGKEKYNVGAVTFEDLNEALKKNFGAEIGESTSPIERIRTTPVRSKRESRKVSI